MFHQLLFFSLISIFLFGCAPSSADNSERKNPPVLATQLNCSNVAMKNHSLTSCLSANESVFQRAPWVIYFFHGIDGSAQDLFQGNIGKMIHQFEDTMGNQSPTFIGLSLGKTGIAKSQDVTEMATAVLPQIEKKLGFNPTQVRRDVIGVSMGAHNALQLAAFKQNYIRSLKLLCPAILAINPFSKTELQAYIQRHPNLNQAFFKRILTLLRFEFPTEKAWWSNNPLHLLEEEKYQNLESLFLSVGNQDDLGFQEGTLAFFKVAQSKQIVTQLATTDGTHCAFDMDALMKSISLN